MIINRRLRALREQYHYTIREMAEKLGVSVTTAHRYEADNGIKEIPYEMIEKYAEIFNVTPSYIMGWDDKTLTFKKTFEELEHNKELSKVEKLERLKEIKHQYDSNSETQNIVKDSEIKVNIHQSSDYLINELIDRLNQIPPRQRAKVIDAIFTLLDNDS